MLKRGGRDITLKKVPDKVVLRLKHGSVIGDRALEAYYGVKKIETDQPKANNIEGLNIFKVNDPSKLSTIIDELRAAEQVDFVGNIYTLGQRDNNEVIPTGTMTVQFKPNVPKENQEKILREFGLKILNSLEILPNAYTVKLIEGSDGDLLTIAVKLQQHDDINIAEPDLSFKIRTYTD